MEFLSGYDFDVAYRPGSSNGTPDFLSRVENSAPDQSIFSVFEDAGYKQNSFEVDLRSRRQ